MGEIILSLLGTMAPTAMRILGMYLDKGQADADTKQKFLDFAQAATKHFGDSASLKASADAQLERLKGAQSAKTENKPTP